MLDGKKYCLDTSGLSNPRMVLPDDIFVSVWNHVYLMIELGAFAVTKGIFSELEMIEGGMGKFISENRKMMLMDRDGDWNEGEYLSIFEDFKERYRSVLSTPEVRKRRTIDQNDLSIVALGKAMRLPVITMESRPIQISQKRKRVPEICDLESVEWLTFNDFLRRENFKT